MSQSWSFVPIHANLFKDHHFIVKYKQEEIFPNEILYILCVNLKRINELEVQ